ASNELWLTNGTDGISGIPGPWRGRVAPQTFNVIYLAMVVLAVLAVLAVCERIRHSPYGRVLRAIRDDDQVAAVAGKRVIAFKVQAFAVSAAILGLAGALWGHYTSFIAPDVFTPLVTIYVVLALTAGGTGNNVGAVLGAALVIFLMEGTRFATGWLVGLAPVQVAALREELIGSLGCASVPNLPVVWNDRVLGTINLLHEAEWYDETDAAIGLIFAGLAVSALTSA